MYTNSSLVDYKKISPHKRSRNGNKISKITIHHTAVVNASLSAIGSGFSGTRQASSNYAIDSNGNIGMYVEEKDRSIASSSTANDSVAVTIEVMNCKGAPNWEVSDAAYKALINLCVDICQRNDIKALNYTGDKNGNLTRHNMFASTACPGPYLQAKFTDIANQVNARLGNGTSATTNPTSAPTNDSLSVGSTGSKVKTLQGNLNGLNYNCGSVDGSYGSKTKSAVIAFQKAYNLTQNGVADTKTLAKIEEVIKALQTKLNALGYSCGTVDGVYGSATKSAVTKFQSANKLTADGIAGEKTMAALNKANSKSEYKVKVTASVLNIRKGPGTSYATCGQIKDKGTYTITEVSGSWGKLKSGAGWISLDYTKKV